MRDLAVGLFVDEVEAILPVIPAPQPLVPAHLKPSDVLLLEAFAV
jgi:hypothetical protein